MATILEALQNARYNLGNVEKIGTVILTLVEDQLNNGLTLLEKGYGLDDEVEPLLEKFGDVENVPSKYDDRVESELLSLFSEANKIYHNYLWNGTNTDEELKRLAELREEYLRKSGGRKMPDLEYKDFR